MERQMIHQCPVCTHSLNVTELHCHQCHTSIKGNFSVSRLARLHEEQLKFVEIFIKCRGNIKEVERELGVSYPTVRGKLENVIEALGYRPEKVTHISSQKRKEILDRLDRGEISADEALKQLNE